jgi:hypothetical protein
VGLQEVKKGTREMVCTVQELVPHAIYTHVPSFKEDFARLLREARHLQQARRDEFAQAMLEHLKHEEPNEVGLAVWNVGGPSVC